MVKGSSSHGVTKGFISKKLDRIMANAQWLDDFADIEVTFLPQEFSDHRAGIIRIRRLMKQIKGFF